MSFYVFPWHSKYILPGDCIFMLLKIMCNHTSMEKNLLRDPHGNSHQLILEKYLQNVAWRISDDTWKSKEYQERFQCSSLVHEDRGQFLIITRSAESDLVDPIICSINYVLDIVAYLYGMELEYFTVNPHRSAILAYHDYVENSKLGNTQESVG